MQDQFEQWCVKMWQQRKVDVLIVVAGVLFGAFFEWDLVEIFIFAIFLWSIVGPLSSRVLAVPALFFLSVTPLLLALGRDDQAEIFAVYAYYFLVMAVVRAIVEMRADEQKEKHSVSA